MAGKRSERGQAIVLMAMVFMVLIGVAGLVIDYGRAFSNRNRSQGMAVNIAMTTAQTYNLHPSSGTIHAIDTGSSLATLNGYESSNVTIVPLNSNANCPSGQGVDFEVTITESLPTTFASAFGIQEINNSVSAVSRSCLGVNGSLFNGNAVVALSPSGYSFNSGSSNAVRWTISGGGIFSNADAKTKRSTSVTFIDTGDCVTAVGTSPSSWGCIANLYAVDQAIDYTYNSMRSLMQYPACPSEATAVLVDGTYHEAPGYEGQGSNVEDWPGDYAPGVYCVNDPSGNYHDGITGTDVTFYLRGDVDLKYNGGGYFGATAPTTGPYAGILVLGDPIGSDTPDAPLPSGQDCTENVEFRGNGSTLSRGTIYLPAACIDFRGNSVGDLQRTQLIGFNVTSNGDGGVAVTFDPEDNYQGTQPGWFQLIR